METRRREKHRREDRPVGFFARWQIPGGGNGRGKTVAVDRGRWDEERAFTGELFRFQKIVKSPSRRTANCSWRWAEVLNSRTALAAGWCSKWKAANRSRSSIPAARCMRAVEFSPDGKEIATGEFGATVAFWEPRTGKQIASLNLPGSPVREINYAPDGRMAAACGDGTVYVMKDHSDSAADWSATKGKLSRRCLRRMEKPSSPEPRMPRSAYGIPTRACLWESSARIKLWKTCRKPCSRSPIPPMAGLW